MRAATWIGLATWAAACASPVSQTVVFIDTSLGVPCEVDTVEVLVHGMGEPRSVTDSLRRDALPLSLTLVPSDDVGATADVEVRLSHQGVLVASARGPVEVRPQQSRQIRFRLDERCREAVCTPLSSEGFDGGVPPAEPPRICPPGGEVERYVAAPARFEVYQSACTMPGRAQLLMNANDREVEVPAEWVEAVPFEFYGERVTRMWLGDNGYLAFTDEAPGRESLTVTGLSEPGAPRPAVVPFWERTETRSAGVCLAAVGRAPYRRLHVTWEDACFFQMGAACDADDHLSYSVVLEETTGRVHVVYGRMDSATADARARGAEATVGVTSQAREACTCDREGLCEDGSTPCGYTEFTSMQALEEGLPPVSFTPVYTP